MISLVFESIIGYAFWSLFHALGPMIWFYPLNELDITGYEVFVLVVFTPILWLSGKLADNVLQTKVFQLTSMMVMLAGIVSFQADKTLERLIMLSIGLGAAFLLKSSTWWSKDPFQCKESFWGYTIGYFMLLSSRIWYKSITPMWNDEYSSKFISTVFSVVLITKLLSSLKHMKPVEKVINRGHYEKPKEVSRERSSVLCSIAYGCICFLMHTFLGEVSVLSRYTVTGISTSSPAPNPWGGCVLLAALFGFILSLFSTLPSNRLWLASGVISSMGLMFLQSWYAFACGLFFVVYLMSVWPTVAENMINCRNPGKCLFWANLVYLLSVFGMVWCTAYNFVPFGGELARERTYILILLASSLVSLSLTKSYQVTIPIRIKLSLPPSNSSQSVPPANSKQDKFVKNAIFFIVLLGLVGFNFRSHQIPKPNINSESQQRGQFSALIWTFHFGYDNQGWPSFERAAQVLNDTGADVITLLESDASKPYLGNNDIAMWLGERLGMYMDFGPSTRDHTWGTLLLSKYPIVRSEHHLLPSPEGELAPAISATINMTGNLVNFVVTHMGNDRDNLDRKLQAQRLAELADQSEHPVVFLGYVTSSPGSRDYKHLLKKGRLRDIDSTDRDRWCEYIMYRDLRRLGYARISHSGLSDTELQMAKWEFYGNGPKVDNDKIAPPYDQIPDSVQFNKVFGERYNGHWHGRSHHFHMDTPKYFKAT